LGVSAPAPAALSTPQKVERWPVLIRLGLIIGLGALVWAAILFLI
jgi:hypothetical protein